MVILKPSSPQAILSTIRSINFLALHICKMIQSELTISLFLSLPFSQSYLTIPLQYDASFSIAIEKNNAC